VGVKVNANAEGLINARAIAKNAPRAPLSLRVAAMFVIRNTAAGVRAAVSDGVSDVVGKGTKREGEFVRRFSIVTRQFC
jgi:hypothetical protein